MLFDLDRHHIQSISKGGPDNANNICNICPNCHRKVHKGYVVIEGKFISLNRGNVVVWRNKGEDSITGSEDPAVWIYGG